MKICASPNASWSMSPRSETGAAGANIRAIQEETECEISLIEPQPDEEQLKDEVNKDRRRQRVLVEASFTFPSEDRSQS